MLRLDKVNKSFFSPQEIHVLHDISMSIEKGQWVSLMGPSGSGKSTLLSILAGLDLPSSGNVEIEGQAFSNLNEEERAHLRAQKMGFIFQSFRLIPHLTIEENIAVPMKILEIDTQKTAHKVEELIHKVGLGHRKGHYPSQLSGGEQQRVAIARAFASEPALLLADEPTGNLDEEKGQSILKMLKDLKTENNTTLVVVSHDPSVAAEADQRFHLKNGRLIME